MAISPSEALEKYSKMMSEVLVHPHGKEAALCIKEQYDKKGITLDEYYGSLNFLHHSLKDKDSFFNKENCNVRLQANEVINMFLIAKHQMLK